MIRIVSVAPKSSAQSIAIADREIGKGFGKNKTNDIVGNIIKDHVSLLYYDNPKAHQQWLEYFRTLKKNEKTKLDHQPSMWLHY